MPILPRSFYMRETVLVARDLLGRILVVDSPEGRTAVRLVETEAYLNDDPACHASRGKTKRNATMFERGGCAYVYFTYGMHFALNFVTGSAGIGEAVLIRAGEPVEGIELMRRRRGEVPDHRLCAGPGNLTRAMGLSIADDGESLTGRRIRVLTGLPVPDEMVVATTRIGISQAKERPWRFYVRDSRYVSRR